MIRQDIQWNRHIHSKEAPIRLGKVGTDKFRAIGTSGTGHAMLPHLLQNFDNLKQLCIILKQIIYNYCISRARMAHVLSGGTTLLFDRYLYYIQY